MRQFRTSNLDRLFQFASSLEDALAALKWSLVIGCPNARCEGDGRSHEPSIASHGGELCCGSCRCRFWVAPFHLSPDGEASIAISRFEIPTYEHEHIRAELDVIANLQIVGRLDLFASEALVDAWWSLPRQRRTLLDLRAATEVSTAGLRFIEEQLRAEVPGDRVVMLVDPERSDRIQAGPLGDSGHNDAGGRRVCPSWCFGGRGKAGPALGPGANRRENGRAIPLA